MSQVDRSEGLVGNTGIKAPVRIATTANITLSAEQTIDGVACVTGDRVLVKDQTDESENGIWVVDTGDWSRAQDFDGAYDAVTGSLMCVTAGTVNGATIWRVSTTGAITIGSTDIEFEKAVFYDAATISFIDSGAGAVTLTVTEALRLFPNVMYYGATGLGVVDDTAAIAAASAAHSILLFPQGTYKVDTSLVKAVTSGTIHWFGQGEVIIDASASASAIAVTLTGSVGSAAALAGNVSAGATTFTTTLLLAAGDMARLLSTTVFSAASATFVKGELHRVKSVAGGPTYTVTIEDSLYDSYLAATTTIAKMNMPRIVMENIKVLRAGNLQGVEISYAQNIKLDSVRCVGSRERGIELTQCIGGKVSNCFADDAYYVGSGTSYGYIVNSCQDIGHDNNAFLSGRHGAAHGGTFPCRNIKWGGGNTIDNTRGLNLASFDIHAGMENFSMSPGNAIRNGMSIDSVKNIVLAPGLVESADYDHGILVSQYDDGDLLSITGTSINQEKAASSGVTFQCVNTGANTTLKKLAIFGNQITATDNPIRFTTVAAAFTYTISKTQIQGNNKLSTGAYSLLVEVGAGATLATDVVVNGNVSVAPRGLRFLHTGDVDMIGNSVEVNDNATQIVDYANTGNVHEVGNVYDGTTTAIAPKYENVGQVFTDSNTIKRMGSEGNRTITAAVTVFTEGQNNFISNTGVSVEAPTAWGTGTLLSGSATYDPPSLNDGVGATTTLTVAGAALGDTVVGVSFSLDLQGITVTGYVSAANTVSVRFQNESGGILDILSGTLRAVVRKS